MKKSINLVIILAVLLSTYQSFGQCKWKTEKIDPISEKEHLESKKIKIMQWSSSLDLILSKKNETNYLQTNLFAGLITDETINNPKLEIKLDDGNLLTLVPVEATGKFHGTAYGITFKFEIDDQDLEKLSQSPPAAFQVSFNAIEKLYEPKRKESKMIMEYASCMR